MKAGCGMAVLMAESRDYFATMIWPQGSDIHGIGDLKGKTIAIPGLSFQKAFLASALESGTTWCRR